MYEMLQSFVAMAPPGPGNSERLAFNFSVFKALLKAQHCGVRFVVKSLLKAPGNNVEQQLGVAIMKNKRGA